MTNSVLKCETKYILETIKDIPKITTIRIAISRVIELSIGITIAIYIYDFAMEHILITLFGNFLFIYFCAFVGCKVPRFKHVK